MVSIAVEEVVEEEEASVRIWEVTVFIAVEGMVEEAV